MSAALWAMVGAASVIVIGAYLRWAMLPVVAAFRIGQITGRKR